MDYRWADLGFAPDGTPRKRTLPDVDDNPIEKDVISLCMKTDFCAQTGLSYFDILQLDFPTYSKLRDEMFAVMNEKAKRHEAIRKETESAAAKL